MTAKHLLDELETLPSHVRIRRMVELGRAAAHDPNVAVTLAALEQGDFYERLLALHSCFGNSDGAHVLRALTDPSRIIRGVAIQLSVLACDEEQLRQALTLGPRDGRLALLWKLRHHGYETLIDAFLEQLAESHDVQLRQLLPKESSHPKSRAAKSKMLPKICWMLCSPEPNKYWPSWMICRCRLATTRRSAIYA